MCGIIWCVVNLQCERAKIVVEFCYPMIYDKFIDSWELKEIDNVICNRINEFTV